MNTAEIVTDAGPAYIKGMGTPQGNHPLACEWIDTNLARWFGLPTFDCAILNLSPADEVLFHEKGKAAPGPAFVTRSMEGDKWGGGDEQLNLLDNPEAITRLVVLDTWLRNYDRHPPAGLDFHSPKPDNVFLSGEGASSGRFRLIAMDFSHCLVTCFEAELDSHVADDSRVRDPGIYGFFPAFEKYLLKSELEASQQLLLTVNPGIIAPIIAEIPLEWDLGPATREGLVRFLSARAIFVADNSIKELMAKCRPVQ